MEIIERNGFKEKAFMEISCLDVFMILKQTAMR